MKNNDVNFYLIVGTDIEEVKNGLALAGETVLKFGDKVIQLSQAGVIDIMNYYNIHLLNVKVIIGIFIGAMLSFAFCAMALRAVGR